MMSNTDLDIARAASIRPVGEIASSLNIPEDKLELYGRFKAKVDLSLIDEKKVKEGNLILVTAITPTPAGEGKTTTSIGLTDGLNQIGKKAIAALREPSLGPVFGMKGGAAGGGHSQVIPMEDINLHFTGDFSAIEKANNLLAAMIDNRIQTKDRKPRIDPRTVLWKRVMDMNDRALRNIITGLGGKAGGKIMETGFNITAASEIMAILCLAESLEDLQRRFENIYVGDTFWGEAVFAKDINASGAMTLLMKDAIKPNLVQTLENNPVFIHGGPFANIAQGTNSLLATKMAMSLGDYAVTEAGFGADLGAEKFFNIKCRAGGISPKAVVLVATIRALKYHGGKPLANLADADPDAVSKGLPNLAKHVENIKSFGLPVVVALNRFSQDTSGELAVVENYCKENGVRFGLSEGWAHGGMGCTDLAQEVVQAVEGSPGKFKPTYEITDPAMEKIEKVCRQIYGARSVQFTAKAKKQLARFEEIGQGNLPVCIAKTQKSFSDDEKLLGRPDGFDITIREFEIASGAGFIVPIAGNILRMPGLPVVPAAEHMGVDENGEIFGLS
ncbi:MAG: formate--tetrahydrofolate ligase [Bacteroidota bacterium]|nr:formate--tetrahydrofolate ligase [Bacteroidota bacterium]